MTQRGRHLAPRIRRLSRGWALPLSLSLVMLMTGLAWADNLDSDGDGLAPVAAQDINFGTVCAGAVVDQDVLHAIRRTGAVNNQVFANGATVTVSVTGTSSASLAATMGADTQITLPGNWTISENNTVSTDTALSTIVFTAPGATGPFSGTVGYSASGPGATVTTTTRTDTVTVTATIEECAPVDVTAPEITITTPADGAAYLLNQVVSADYVCQDEAGGSGLASCDGSVPNGDPIDTTTVGAKTFTVDAEDNAGNTATLTHNYTVVYDFAGFFQPVENPDVWNKAKAGQGIPVKFSLGGNQGLDIFKTGSPTAVQVACPSGTGTTYDAIETTTANSSGLIYDADAGQYVYVWKTPKTLDGKCYKFKLGLNDGSSWYALFDFRK